MGTFSFYLRPGSDDDIAAALKAESNQCEAIRQALRAWYGKRDDIAERLDRIESLLQSNCTVTKADTSSHDEVDVSAIDQAMEGW